MFDHKPKPLNPKPSLSWQDTFAGLLHRVPPGTDSQGPGSEGLRGPWEPTSGTGASGIRD